VGTIAGQGYLPRMKFIGFAEAFVIATAKRAGVPPHRIRDGVERVRCQHRPSTMPLRRRCSTSTKLNSRAPEGVLTSAIQTISPLRALGRCR